MQTHLPPKSHGRRTCRRQGLLGTPAVSTGQAPCAQQNTAEIARHHAAYIGHILPLKHLQHRLPCRSLGLTVVAVAHDVVADQIAPAVVPRIVVLRFHRLDVRLRFFFRFHRPDMPDEAGTLFRKLTFGRFVRHTELLHSQSSLVSTQPSI